jgi:hypothetical protein
MSQHQIGVNVLRSGTFVPICRSLPSKRRKFLSSRSAAEAKNPVLRLRRLSFAKNEILRSTQDDMYHNLPDNVLRRIAFLKIVSFVTRSRVFPLVK